MDEIKKEDYKDIELRSEEVQEIMGKIPHWILRWGITVLFFIVTVLFIGCYFFKYPDTLAAEATVTTATPPVSVIARSTGKLDRIHVRNLQQVEPGEILAVIQNTTHYEDILSLAQKMRDWQEGRINLTELSQWMSRVSLQLGEIQGTYAMFQKCTQEYLDYRQLNYYPRKIKMKQEQQTRQKDVFSYMENERKLGIRQMEIAASIFYRDSVLYDKEIMTGEEYDRSLQNYLQSKQNILNLETSEKQTGMQQLQNEEVLLDLEKQHAETSNQYTLSMHSATDQLIVELKNWEQNYVLKSPIKGTVNLMGIWSPNQNVNTGELVFIILPANPDAPMGKAMLPAAGAGKVEPGQRVNLRLNNFPDQEFGYLVGKVNSVSNVPTEKGEYMVEITFPDGLTTSYDRQLPPTQQMLGEAQIIIQDKRLIERFFQPIRKLLESAK